MSLFGFSPSLLERCVRHGFLFPSVEKYITRHLALEGSEGNGLWRSLPPPKPAFAVKTNFKSKFQKPDTIQSQLPQLCFTHLQYLQYLTYVPSLSLLPPTAQPPRAFRLQRSPCPGRRPPRPRAWPGRRRLSKSLTFRRVSKVFCGFSSSFGEFYGTLAGVLRFLLFWRGCGFFYDTFAIFCRVSSHWINQSNRKSRISRFSTLRTSMGSVPVESHARCMDVTNIWDGEAKECLDLKTLQNACASMKCKLAARSFNTLSLLLTLKVELTECELDIPMPMASAACLDGSAFSSDFVTLWGPT